MKFEHQTFDAERALYGIRDAQVIHCRFAGPQDGESALKESEGLLVQDCFFDLRYPFWHTKQALLQNCTMSENCRAALWYDEDITLKHCELNGIKAFRECHGKLALQECVIHSAEFGWRCSDMRILNCQLEGEYPFFECSDMEVDALHMRGKYSFQYTKSITIRNSDLDTKDAFWHSENVEVYDSVLRGEYLGWYAKNLKLVRCHIIGTQPLCYCDGLIMQDCTMEGCDLSFENSEVQACIKGSIDSIKNPRCGRIQADVIQEFILDTERMNPDQLQIIIPAKSHV